MTKRERRIRIVKDALRQIPKLDIRFDTGYLVEQPETLGEFGRAPRKGNARPFVKQLRQTCSVCALGACLLSSIDLFNKVKLEKLGKLNNGIFTDETVVIEALSNSFSPTQMVLIEAAFELEIVLRCIDDEYFPSEDELDAAIAFGKRYATPRERLRAIFKNILRHNGDFKLPKLKRAVEDTEDIDCAMAAA